ncbi:hypothetical protein B0O80DRAFT_259986 [Mortierella sp. GBAus27b]|nr:hypothetical protein B0O80DRAFT_259986 [Mortierella sp. GBAus27b]
MMVTSQSFRVTGKQEVQDIICDNVDGQNVVFWDDITYVFPEALHVKIGNTVVSMVRDSNRQRIQPLCIKHFPGVVLDVVLSTSSSSVEATTMSSSSLPGNDPTNAASTAPLDIQTEGNSSAPLSVTITANEMIVDSEMSTPNRPDPEPSTGLTINATIPSDHAAKHASVSTPELSVNEQLSMLQDEQTQIRSLLDRCHSLARAIWNDKAEKSDQLNNLYMRYLEGLKSSTAQLKELQKALEDTHTYDPGQLALLQRRIQTVLSQNHKIYENTAPRLFIVLPQDIQHWNSKAPFSNKFRLHFLCDCGEHTKPASSTTPHHIHFAKHEGYDISRLKEFFWRYGTHVLTIMKMLKFGISSAGVTVRPVSQLTSMDIVGRDAESLEGEMDQVIDCIEKIAMDNGVNHAARVSEYLWQLDAFLTRGDDEEFGNNEEFGNLFRIVNAEGYFRWICVDHFRGIHPEKEAEALCAILKSPTDLFQERYGRVVVTLDSREKANQFYQEFGRIKSIYYLDIEIRWDMITRDDLKKLRDTLDKTNVSLSIMDMSLPQEEPTTDHSNDDDDTQLCDLLFDIMGHANIRSFAMFNLPKEFFQQASLLSHDRNFSNLRLLNIGAKHLDTSPESMDIPGLKKILSKATNLGSLTLNDLEGDPLQIYDAIVEYQTFPFYIPGQFVILARTNEGNGSSSSSSSRQPMDTIMDREELLRVHGRRIETLNLCKIKMDESTLKALAESIKDDSSLTELRLPEIDPSVWESCGCHLAIIVSRSDLYTLAVRFGGGEAGVHLLESVQWNCILSLEIRMDNVVRLGTRIMQVSLHGIRHVPKNLFDDFALYSDCSEQVTDQTHGLLQSFLESISLHRELCLHVTLTLDQICTLLKSMDLSKVRCLSIRAKGFGMAQVEVILKVLEHAAKLRKVTLLGAKHTAGQRKRMEAKGIQLQ